MYTPAQPTRESRAPSRLIGEPVDPGALRADPVLHVEQQPVCAAWDRLDVRALSPIPLNARLGIEIGAGESDEVCRRGAHQAEGVHKRMIAVPLEGAADPAEDGELVGLGGGCEPEIEPAGLSEVAPIADPNHARPQGIGAACGVDAEQLLHVVVRRDSRWAWRCRRTG